MVVTKEGNKILTYNEPDKKYETQEVNLSESDG